MNMPESENAGATGIIDMRDRGLLSDPFGGYSRIREEMPVTRAVDPEGTALWLVTRYNDVKQVLNDPRFANNPASVTGMQVTDLRRKSQARLGLPESNMRQRLNNILEYDGADHTRLRTLVSRGFTPRRISRLRPRIEQIAAELLDRLPDAAENGVVELLEHYAFPLPGSVICEVVGIPRDDQSLWRDWHRVIQASDDRGKAEAWRASFAYVEELAERRRAERAAGRPEEPASGDRDDRDVLTVLLEAETADGERLSESETVGMVHVLMTAGQQSTANTIGNGTVALRTHPEQLALLRENPELMPQAVNELLRWCGAIHATHVRYATENVELGGVRIGKGEAVVASLGGADYDPRAFEAPERLDVTARKSAGPSEGHVAFGYGPHFCLGAALARLEIEVALAALFRRFPGLTLAVDPDDLQRAPIPEKHWRLERLPVRL